MDIPGGLLSRELTLVAWLLFAAVSFQILRRAPWRQLADGARLNVWLGAIVALMLLWGLKAGVKPGLSLHLLGATLLTLLCGPQLAFAGLCLVLAAVSLNEFGWSAGWSAFAANALLTGGVAVAVTQTVLRIGERVLPRNLFAYIFFNGFFAAALAVGAAGSAGAAVLVAAGIYPAGYVLAEYLPYVLLLGFAEAWLTGMTVTLMVVYRPEWVSTFDDSRYLRDK